MTNKRISGLEKKTRRKTTAVGNQLTALKRQKGSEGKDGLKEEARTRVNRQMWIEKKETRGRYVRL